MPDSRFAFIPNIGEDGIPEIRVKCRICNYVRRTYLPKCPACGRTESEVINK